MKVSELIEKLMTVNQDALVETFCGYYGCPTQKVHVTELKNGSVMICDCPVGKEI